METTASSRYLAGTTASGSGVLLLGAMLVGLAFGICWHVSSYPLTAPGNRVQMEKDSGKHEKHSNQKAREAAERNYQRVKKQIEALNNKPANPGGRSPEDKKLLKKLRDQLEHWRKKKDWSGEHHSQKGKGN